ncbi:MAG: hypothetical protein AAF411_11095 [Myxococcota bacterium]
MASEGKDAPRFSKGDDLEVVGGKSAGARGEVFWTGPNKFGPGFRYGMRTADGQTHWVDEADVKPAEGPAPEAEPKAPAKPALTKGSTVRITGGREGVGRSGEVFWSGPNKFGPGHRYGVRDGDDTFWVDENQIEVLQEAAAASESANEFRDDAADFRDAGSFSDAADFEDDGPPPSGPAIADGDFPPLDDDEAPMDEEDEFFDEDAPF